MQLLVRDISAYTFHRLLLGCFTSVERAQEARQRYIESRCHKDPWHNQAYQSANLGEDVFMIPVDELEVVDLEGTTDEGTVWVISCMSEGFGQTIRDLVAVCGSSAAAEQAALRIDKERREEDRFFTGCIIQKLELNEVMSDDQETQSNQEV